MARRVVIVVGELAEQLSVKAERDPQSPAAQHATTVGFAVWRIMSPGALDLAAHRCAVSEVSTSPETESLIEAVRTIQPEFVSVARWAT